MNLSARFHLNHPNGFLRTYVLSGFGKHRSDLLLSSLIVNLPPQSCVLG